MNTKLLYAVAAIGFSIVAVAADAPKVEYSADSSMETAQGAMKGRVYSAPGKERREMNQGGQKMITILRQDKKVVWMLMPEQKMYMEMSTENKSHRPENISDYKIEQTVVGPETVNGVSATKSKVVMTDSKGHKMGGFMWTTSDKIVVRTDVIAMDKGSKMRMKNDLTNLKVGKQDPALFEIPAGYSRMDMGSMMGGARRR